MPRLAANKRVRTAIMGGSTSLATTVDFGPATVDTEIFQDDVTVIGLELWTVALISDAHLNADGKIHAHAEISRHGTMGQPGSLINSSVDMGWTGILSVGGETWKIRTIFFPVGYGVEIDEGEGLNINMFAEWTGTGNLTFDAHGIIYYVER